MSKSLSFKDHWLNIDSDRMECYDKMFQWTSASEAFFAPADIHEGHIVADFGCGPGCAAVEFAKRVGPTGHVHALDINPEFLAKAKANAQEAGLGKRVTCHELVSDDLPLAAASLDRVVARNTLIYVEDPVTTYREFGRVLRPGGLVHVIEGDWSLTVVEPLATKQWRGVIQAASWAWRRPEIGRSLYGIARKAGFKDVSLQVLTVPDTTGRLRGMIQTVVGYAHQSGELAKVSADEILQVVDDAIENGTYLAISPQFLVTANL